MLKSIPSLYVASVKQLKKFTSRTSEKTGRNTPLTDKFNRTCYSSADELSSLKPHGTKGSRMHLHMKPGKGSKNAFNAYKTKIEAKGKLFVQKMQDATDILRQKQHQFMEKENIEKLTQQARMYADSTRDYARQNVGTERIVPIGCLSIALIYYYIQSHKNRALYRNLEKARCADIENLTNIQKAAQKTREKIEYDISTKENQIRILTEQNVENMRLIDTLTGSLKLCEFQKKGHLQPMLVTPPENVEASKEA